MDSRREELIERAGELIREFNELNEKYKEKFQSRVGMLPFGSFTLEQYQRAIEVMKRAIERGTEITDEEYYLEIYGWSREFYEQYRRGEFLI